MGIAQAGTPVVPDDELWQVVAAEASGGVAASLAIIAGGALVVVERAAAATVQLDREVTLLPGSQLVASGGASLMDYAAIIYKL